MNRLTSNAFGQSEHLLCPLPAIFQSEQDFVSEGIDFFFKMFLGLTLGSKYLEICTELQWRYTDPTGMFVDNNEGFNSYHNFIYHTKYFLKRPFYQDSDFMLKEKKNEIRS